MVASKPDQRQPGTWPNPVQAFADRLDGLGWISDLFVSGSLATGDYRPGVSDIDLVAVTNFAVTPTTVGTLAALHGAIDPRQPERHQPRVRLPRPDAHPRSRGRASDLDPRTLHQASPVTDRPRRTLPRRKGGVRTPVNNLFPPVTDDEVRNAARAELAGYGRTAAQRPWWWLDPTITDLGLTAMARSRHAIATGQLMTKSAAIEYVNAPDWLRSELKARRDGHHVRSARLKTAWIAWLDARHTTSR